MLTRKFSVARSINLLLALAVLFPFIPRLVQSTDTQPTFLTLLTALIVVSVFAPSAQHAAIRVSLSGLTLLALVTLTLYAMVLAANLVLPHATIVSRVVSFVQFCTAALWAYTSRFDWSPRLLYRVVLVYSAFTVVYFLTGGALEDILMRSRMEGAESLIATGRGARTLSPEPSFFALQTFSIFVLARLTGFDERVSRRLWATFVLLVVFCLLASLSAFGALLAPVVIAVAYPRSALIGAGAMIVFFGALPTLLSRWESVRAVRVLLVLIESGGSIAGLVLLDASVASRVNSFTAYVRDFTANPLLGNAFSLWEGGGFISIIAAFGILGLLFFTAALLAIVFGRFRMGTRLALLAWFTVNFISGPIGVPIVGVIIGTMFRQLRAARHARQSLRPEPSPLAVST